MNKPRDVAIEIYKILGGANFATEHGARLYSFNNDGTLNLMLRSNPKRIAMVSITPNNGKYTVSTYKNASNSMSMSKVAEMRDIDIVTVRRVFGIIRK